VAGILTGAIVDIGWLAFLSSTGIYEIIPGFVLGGLAAIVVSLCSKAPTAERIIICTLPKEEKNPFFPSSALFCFSETANFVFMPLKASLLSFNNFMGDPFVVQIVKSLFTFYVI